MAIPKHTKPRPNHPNLFIAKNIPQIIKTAPRNEKNALRPEFIYIK